MSKRNVFLIGLALVVALAAPPAFAQGKGKGGGGSHGQGKSGSAHVERAPGGSNHHHVGVNEPGPDKRPAGWDKGKKVGWGDCNVPPGLAKKRGCDASGLSHRERAAKLSKQRADAEAKAKAGRKATTSTTGTKPRASSTSGTTRTTTNTTATGGTRSVGGNTSSKVRPVKE